MKFKKNKHEYYYFSLLNPSLLVHRVYPLATEQWIYMKCFAIPICEGMIRFAVLMWVLKLEIFLRTKSCFNVRILF